MLAIDSEGKEDFPPESASTEVKLNALIEIVEEQSEKIEEQATQIEEQSERIDELEAELSQHQKRSAKERAETKKRVTELEEQSNEDNPTPEDGETTIHRPDLTPIERLAESEEISEVTESASVERAVTLFENIRDWGVKTPKGYVIRPKDNPRQLLEADRDENLHWKQYYRAAKALERLSKGACTFFDSDRHGKMIVLHEQSEAYDRVTNQSLTPSSVEATT